MDGGCREEKMLGASAGLLVMVIETPAGQRLEGIGASDARQQERQGWCPARRTVGRRSRSRTSRPNPPQRRATTTPRAGLMLLRESVHCSKFLADGGASCATSVGVFSASYDSISEAGCASQPSGDRDYSIDSSMISMAAASMQK